MATISQIVQNKVVLHRYLDLLAELCDHWKPTDINAAIINAVVLEGKKRVVVESGRQIGKGESLIALFGLWSQLVPGSQSYYLAPLLTQAKEIMWASGRIEKIIPKRWLGEFFKAESRVYFTGSKDCFLKIDGCDKFDRKRGIAFHKGIVALDECRDLDQAVVDTIRPALGVHSCPLVMTSTPPTELKPYPNDPQRDHWFIEECESAKVEPDSAYFHFRTADNPHFPKEEIEKAKARLYAVGRGFEYEREYEGQRVEGKVTREFPMLADRSKFVFPHQQLIAEIERDKSKLEWYCMTDPAAASVWAWLFVAINPYSKRIYLLDEIYETDKAAMAPSQIWPRALAKMMELHDDFDAWFLHYDEAETWFSTIMTDQYQVTFSPSLKTSRSKREGFSMWADIFLGEMAAFSDRCAHTFAEFLGYEDETSPDHNVDNGRYLLNVSNYTVVGEREPKPVVRMPKRGVTMEQVIEEIRHQGDWTHRILEGI